MRIFLGVIEAVSLIFATVFFMTGDHGRACYFLVLAVYMHLLGRMK